MRFTRRKFKDCGKEFKGKDVMMAYRRNCLTGKDVARCKECGGGCGSIGEISIGRVEAAVGLKCGDISGVMSCW